VSFSTATPDYNRHGGDKRICLPVGLAYAFCISVSGVFYPRHVNQDNSERIMVKALSVFSYARFTDARSAKWARQVGGRDG
jgi:hypothetical protein